MQSQTFAIMKKTLALTLLFALGTLCSTFVFAANPKREFRATWLTTHYRIDWPSTLATNASGITAQKRQLCAILDTLKAGNINAVMDGDIDGFINAYLKMKSVEGAEKQ